MIFLVLATSFSWKLNTFSYILNLLGNRSARSHITSNCSCSLAVLEIRTKLSYHRYLKSIFRTRQLLPLSERPITQNRNGCTGHRYSFFSSSEISSFTLSLFSTSTTSLMTHSLFPDRVIFRILSLVSRFVFASFSIMFFYICYSSRI